MQFLNNFQMVILVLYKASYLWLKYGKIKSIKE
jgi:hypothetical protein